MSGPVCLVYKGAGELGFVAARAGYSGVAGAETSPACGCRGRGLWFSVGGCVCTGDVCFCLCASQGFRLLSIL